MTGQEWIEFGATYDEMIEDGLIPNLITTTTCEGTEFAIYLTSEDTCFDTTLEEIFDEIEQWYDSPLSAIKKSYFENCVDVDSSEILDNLSDLDLDKLMSINGNSELSLSEIIARLVSRGITDLEMEAATKAQDMCNCRHN